ncbi:hypothetical protein [Nocardia sp. NPDC004260]
MAGPGAPPGLPRGSADRAAAIDRVAQLPPDRFPELIEIARAAATVSSAAEFRNGLRISPTGLRTE